MKNLNVNCLSVQDRLYVSRLLQAGLPVPSHLMREMKLHKVLSQNRALATRAQAVKLLNAKQALSSLNREFVS